MNTVPARVDWVDAAKGICIVLVVMMHSTLGVEAAAGATGWMGLLVEFARPFRMPDFFLVSGLFLARVLDRDWRTFIDRRVVHFLYFYLLWVVIQFAVKAPVFVGEYGATETALLFLASLTYEPFGTLWFIWILPVFAVAVRLTRWIPVPAMLLAAAVLEIAPIHTGSTAVDEFAARFVYFYAGYALAPAIFRLADASARRPGLALAGMGGWAVLNGVVVFSGFADLPVISLALGSLGAVAVVTTAVLVAQTVRPAAIASFLGERSIVVYLAFFLPMAVTREVLLRTGLVTDIGTIALLVTLAGVVVPFFMKAVADRLGMRFLFERPRWARLREVPRGRPVPVLQAAE